MTIPGLVTLRVARFQRYIATANGSHQNIAQIAVACARKMCMREAEDRSVLIAIPRSPFIALLKRTNLGVGRKLHHAERRRRSWKRVPFRPGADERVDQFERIGR